MNEKESIQVFGVSREGDQITGSTTLEDLLEQCEAHIQISDVHVLIMDNGDIRSKKIGRIGLQFYPEEDTLKETVTTPQVAQVPAPVDTTLRVDEAPGLKIKTIKPRGKKRGRPRKVTLE